MARKRNPTRHGVEFRVPALALRKSDVVFTVFRDEETLGTLYVSRGALVWWSRSGKVGRKLPWDRFDDLLHQYGSRVRGS